jgi:serine/threonine protein kinase
MSAGSIQRTGVALVVGVGSYHSTSITPLRFASRDARALARLLSDPDICGFAQDQIALLTDRDARRRLIVEHLSTWLPERTRGADIAVIYFACHGVQQEIGGDEEGYLLPYDADPDKVVASGVAMAEVASLMNGVLARAVVVLLDCCHAGHVLTREATISRSLPRDMSIKPVVFEKLLGRNRFLIAACDKDQKSIELPDLKHGLFTYHLLKGMAGAADGDGDGRVGVYELSTYVSQAVGRDALRFGHAQTPWAKGEWKEQIFLSSPGLRPEEKNSTTPLLERLWKELGPDRVMADLEGQLRDQGEPWLRSVLGFLRKKRDPVTIPFLFHCLAHHSEPIRERAKKFVAAHGWEAIAASSLQVARHADAEHGPERVGFLLDGLAAIEANPEVIRLLDDLVAILRGALRTRAILLLERKRLSLDLEAMKALFESKQSPYRIEKALGQGVFTAAYLATHEHAGVRVVIRVLRSKFVDDHPVRLQFLEVSRRTFTYNHPGLVLTRDIQAIAEARIYYTVRDYIEGVTLQDVLAQEKKFEPVQVLEILRQVLEALTPVHRSGACHCGIKPSNLFLCEAEPVRMVVGDPGLPIPHFDLQRLCYDYRYAAPEMFRGGGFLCPQSDFYSLGCVGYELLCGAPPFLSDNVFDLGAKHVHEPIRPPSRCGVRLGPVGDDFFNRLLAKDPPGRYRDISEAIQALDAVRDHLLGPSETGSRPVTILQRHSLIQFDPIHSIIALPGDPELSTSSLDYSSTGSQVTDDLAADLAAAVSLTDPTQIGRYRIIRRLGQGSFGRVFLALDTQLQRQVAIKVPSSNRFAGSKVVEAYVAEARILAQLDHPNIVPVYDVGRTHDGLWYVVSKYIEGRDLAAGLRETRLSFRESAQLAEVVAEALQHAHTQGLVHRDIKPSNILLDWAGRPYVVDFGLALKDEDYGKGARLAGTPAYMSPEQAREEGHRVDGRSDIFSLGVVLYELLTGRKPFRGESRAEVMDQIANVEALPPRQIDETIPRELERICLKALAKRVSERYHTARELAEDLRYFLGAGEGQETSRRAVGTQGISQEENRREVETQRITLEASRRTVEPQSISRWLRRLRNFFRWQNN